MRKFEELQKADPAVFVAFAAATCAEGLGDDLLAPFAYKKSDQDSSAAAVLEDLAPFVRAYPTAPTEALYRHAAARGTHDGAPDKWRDLPLAGRAAFAMFRKVLILADRFIAEEKALEASQNPQVPRADFVPIEDTILDAGAAALDVDQRLQRELDRPVRIIPGTGLPPGHVPDARRAPPAVSADNTVQPHIQFANEPRDGKPAADDTDPRAEIALALAAQNGAGPVQPSPISGMPAVGGSLAPGGAVPLGHGFDPEAPFVERPAGIEDELGVRNAPETGGAPELAAAAIGPGIAEQPARPAVTEEAPAPAAEGEALPIETRHVQTPEAALAPAAGEPGTVEPSGSQNPGVPDNTAGENPEPDSHDKPHGKSRKKH